MEAVEGFMVLVFTKAEGRRTRGGERSTVIPSSGGRGSGGGEAYGGGGVYSGIVMEVVVVKEVVRW